MFFINFSCRKMLQKMYYEWLKQDKDLVDCDFNIICFLTSQNLLNGEKLKTLWERYLELEEKAKNGEEYSIKELLGDEK